MHSCAILEYIVKYVGSHTFAFYYASIIMHKKNKE